MKLGVTKDNPIYINRFATITLVLVTLTQFLRSQESVYKKGRQLTYDCFRTLNVSRLSVCSSLFPLQLTVEDFQEFEFLGAKDLAAMFLFYQLCEDIPDFRYVVVVAFLS